jgi:hypothetical protein
MADVSFFDFALIENLDSTMSVTNGDLFAYAKRCGCPVGVAHTDMFKFIKSLGEDPYRYFKKMAEAGIFWEMNVNYDSVHNFKTHDYVTEFFKNKEQQEIIRKTAAIRLRGQQRAKAEIHSRKRKNAGKKVLLENFSADLSELC